MSLWEPSTERVARAQITAFANAAAEQSRVELPDTAALHRWSVENPEPFWRLLWDFAEIVGEPGEIVLQSRRAMPGARWFPGAQLSFAENLLRRRDAAPALVFRSEDGTRRTLSFAELAARTSQLAQALHDLGVQPGDRVAGVLPNAPEAVVAMLATASLGAIWSSCSPDFGVQGILDRFGQIEPAVLFGADGYRYAGKPFERLAVFREVLSKLPSVRKGILVSHLHPEPREAIPGVARLEQLLARYTPGELDLPRFPFDHPLYILFSSGTTGPPKCIVHGAGGTLLQHAKEHRLHVDLRAGETLFYFTTCGWMMWNWLVSGLATGATLVLYDGSPFHPGPQALFDLVDAERIDVLGISAKWVDAVAKAGVAPIETHDLGSLRTILSTGSPLLPEGFDYVYERVKRDVCLSSMSGGTDIIGCFVGGNPAGPVFRGEIQAPCLGMAVDVFDDAGHPLPEGKGELVCTAPFPSMPVGFWNDPDGDRYRAAYFERFPGVWHHGDFAERTEHGGFVIHGRSDAVLNPGGVRIGTAEIYRQVERLPEVVESLAIGQEWENDVRVVLFVVLREGQALTDALASRIRDEIRRNTSPRHVPARIVAVADLPRTRSGKLTELAVRDVVHGRPVANREALANPEALELFQDLPELRS